MISIVVLGTAGAAVLAAGPGYSTDRPRLLAGAAWLASSGVGQLTLLDGSSAEVAAQVQVAAPGDKLDVLQDGSSAYAVDQTAGTVRRVDGATFTPTVPVSPVPGARDGLRVFAGPDVLYTLDSRRGVLVSTDPHTLTARTGPLPLAAQVDPQAVALDGAGRLWLLDASTGDLVWVARGHRHLRPHATEPGAGRLTMAGGVPVLVDTQARTAQVLDPESGAARHTIQLDLRADDQIAVGGATRDPRLYVVAARGVLTICELAGAACNSAVPLPVDHSQPGVPVEAGGRVFVPDNASGRVLVVDLHELRVVARPQVLSPAAPFQLLTRDGVVFFNDPASERAGVIKLDGGVRPTAKYDPKSPGRGLVGGGAPDAPAAGSQLPVPPALGAPQPPGSSPSTSPSLLPPAQQPVPIQPVPPPPGVPQLTVSVSDAPSVGHAVTLTVKAAGPVQPRSAHWWFGDGQETDGLSPGHAWQEARTFLVSVQVTFPDGRSETTSVNVYVAAAPGRPTPTPTPTGPAPTTPPPTTPPANFTLTVRIAGNTNKGSVTVPGQADPCQDSTSPCTYTVPRGQKLTLHASPFSPPVQFDSWSGNCSGTNDTCSVTMNQNQTVTATFYQAVLVNIDLIESPSGTLPDGCCTVNVSGAQTLTCNSSHCSLENVKPGSRLTFQAFANQSPFAPAPGWGGDCAGQGTTCTLTATGEIMEVQKPFEIVIG